MADAAREQIRRRGATYQDVLDAPEHLVAEIVGGDLVLSPRPTPRHGTATYELAVQVHPFQRGKGGGGGDEDDPGGWRILPEPELHLGEGGRDVVVPDLAGWRRERMPEVPDEAYVTLPPDWVCEVLSPSTARHDRIVKAAVYLSAGVRWHWFVDPLQQTLEVLRRVESDDGPHWAVVGAWAEDARVRAEPFAAIEIDLALLWE